MLECAVHTVFLGFYIYMFFAHNYINMVKTVLMLVKTMIDIRHKNSQ